eukprot:gene6976-8318_t
MGNVPHERSAERATDYTQPGAGAHPDSATEPSRHPSLFPDASQLTLELFAGQSGSSGQRPPRASLEQLESDAKICGQNEMSEPSSAEDMVDLVLHRSSFARCVAADAASVEEARQSLWQRAKGPSRTRHFLRSQVGGAMQLTASDLLLQDGQIVKDVWCHEKAVSVDPETVIYKPETRLDGKRQAKILGQFKDPYIEGLYYWQ